MTTPSVDWDERVPEGEEAELAALAERLVRSQAKTREEQGPGRPQARVLPEPAGEGGEVMMRPACYVRVP